LLDIAGQLYTEINLTQTELRDARAAAGAAASAMDIAKRMVALNPADRLPRNALANAYMNLGRANLVLGKLEDSAAEFRESVGVREQLANEEPQNVVYRRELMVAYGTLGDVLGLRSGENLGDTAGAAAAFRKAADIALWLQEKDPADKKAKTDVASAYLRLGSIQIEDPAQARDGLRHLEATARVLADLIAADQRNARLRYLLLYVHRKTGEGLDALGRENEAVAALERAAAMAPELIKGSDGPNTREQLVLITTRLARIEAGLKNRRALDLARDVATQIARSPTLFRVSPWAEQAVYHDLGRIYLRMKQPDEARPFLEKSLQRLQSIKPAAVLEAKRQKELASVEADLAGTRQ
jgi:tetratricopeptide (TPR) repeat protein